MSNQAWLGVKHVHERFGGLLGRDTIIRLMKEQHIKSYWVGRALATTESAIEDFESRILETNNQIEFKDGSGKVILTIMPSDFIPFSKRKANKKGAHRVRAPRTPHSSTTLKHTEHV